MVDNDGPEVDISVESLQSRFSYSVCGQMRGQLCMTLFGVTVQQCMLFTILCVYKIQCIFLICKLA